MATIIISIVLIALAIALVVCVLFQQGKERGLTGAISGTSESYYGKGKTRNKDKMLSRLTLIGAVAFCAIVLVLYIMQDVTTAGGYIDDNYNQQQTTTTTASN